MFNNFGAVGDGGVVLGQQALRHWNTPLSFSAADIVAATSVSVLAFCFAAIASFWR